MAKKIVNLEEPSVRDIKAPKKEELCRVGVVLEEDNKTIINVVLPKGEFEIKAGKKVCSLQNKSAQEIVFKVIDDLVICSDVLGEEILRSRKFIELSKINDDKKISPQSGILLKSVVAGRGFHWQKEVDLTFPGKLEFHKKNNRLIVVNVVGMEDYLACVVTSEMSSECPPEFIKAQATAARSWMTVFLKDKHKDVPYYICNDDCCQRYQGTTHLKKNIADIVGKSKGVFIITERGFVCASYYSKSCGGIIEKVENIFGKGVEGFSDSIDAPEDSKTIKFSPITEKNVREWVKEKWRTEADSFCSPSVCPEEELPKYLGAVDEAGKYFRWRVEYSHDEIVEILREKGKLKDIVEFVDFAVKFRGNSGRIHKLEIIYKNDKGIEKLFKVSSQYEIRYVLHKKFLFSSGFVWDLKKDKNGNVKKIILTGAGWGHGAGFCQIGALGMSLKGYSYEEILKHYFNKTTLEKKY